MKMRHDELFDEEGYPVLQNDLIGSLRQAED